MSPKIIELVIEDGDDSAGLDGVALVNQPAHEATFEFFNEDKPCEDGNCNRYVLADEEIPQVIQMFHAYGEPQGLLESEGFYIDSVKPVGKQEFQILADPNAPSAQDTPTVKFRYKYVGGLSANSRDFCKEMIRANRVFRIEDIMEMSNRSVNPIGPSGYSIFEYRGSYNCKHRWVQLVYKQGTNIVNKSTVRKGLIDEDGMPGPDTRTTATIKAGNTPPRTGFSNEQMDINVSGLSPYVEQIGDPEKKPVLTAAEGNINVLGYNTRFYHLCPVAIELFTHLSQMDLGEDTQGMVRSAAQVLDNIFRIEDEVINNDGGTIEQLTEAVLLADDFEDIMEEINEDTNMPHDISFVEGHLEKISSYVKKNMAEVGERGGIKESKKAPKSDTPNPNPKGEGTAKGDASSTRGAKVSERVEGILKDKADDFNKRYKDKLDYGVDLGMLKSVYQRGVGAYNVSHSPNVSSAEQWALARVNAFLYLVKEGRPQNKKYDGDNDLLPKKHPKYVKQSEEFNDDGSYRIDEFASFDDYPKLIRENAQKALDYIERSGNPNDCMTQVGKVRAQQLAQGKPISIETVKRMKAYIERHKVDLESSKSYEDGCGALAMDAWGGIEALPWVESTIKKYEEMSTPTELTFSVFNNEQRLVVGPAMIPDKMIIRRNEITGEIYYVYFTADTIKKLQQKYMKDKLLDKNNIEHGRKFLRGVDVVESWIVEDPKLDKQQVFNMEYPKGTWMLITKVEDNDTWQQIKDGKLRGYSVQGYFLEKAKFNRYNDDLINEIKKILKEVK